MTPDPSLTQLLGTSRRRRTTPLLIGGALLAAVVGGVVWSARTPTPTWQTAEVTTGDLTETITAVGTLEPRVSVEVGSRLTGQIEAVLVEVNDTVTEGQVLATLEAKTFQTAVERAQASVASARAGLVEAQANAADAERDRARIERLLTKGAAARVDLDDAVTRVQTTAASVTAARAQVTQAVASQQEAEEDQAKAVIRAPIAGVVTRRLVDPGQTVVSAMSATALFEIASDLRDLEVEVDVDEADVPHVAKGQAATFTVPAWAARRFVGSVATVDVAPDEDADVVTYRAVLTVPNDDLALRPGMTVTASVEVARHDAVVLVPSGALRFQPSTEAAADGDGVWVLGGDTLRRVPVEAVASDGGTTAVTGALSPGDRVLVGEGV